MGLSNWEFENTGWFFTHGVAWMLLFGAMGLASTGVGLLLFFVLWPASYTFHQRARGREAFVQREGNGTGRKREGSSERTYPTSQEARQLKSRIMDEHPRSLADFLSPGMNLSKQEERHAKKLIERVRKEDLIEKLNEIQPTIPEDFETYWPNPTPEEKEKIERHIKVNKEKEQRRNRLSDLTEQAKKASLIDLEKQIRAVYGEVDSPFGSGSLIVGFCVKEHDLAKEEARHRIASAMRDEWLSEKGATLVRKFAERNSDWLGEAPEATSSSAQEDRRTTQGWRKRRDQQGNISYSSPQDGAPSANVRDEDDATPIPDNRGRRFRNLRDALDRADCNVPSDEALLWLLKSECRTLRRERFRRAITDENPETLDDFVRALLDRYGQDWDNYLDWFSEILEENGVEVDEAEIRQKKEEIERERELDRFEEQLLSGEGAGSRIQELDAMSGEAFEEYLEDLFSKMGYTVERTDLVGDQGADLIVRRFGERIVVQAKRYATDRTVGNDAVQQVVGAVGHYDADRGIVVTTASFSSSAQDLAESNDVELWDREKLAELVQQYP